MCQPATAQTFEWARKAEASVMASVSGIVPETSGAVVLGNFYNDIHFDSVSLYSSARDIFLTRFDVSGKTVWTKRFGGPYDDFGTDIRRSKDGSYYIAGSFFKQIAFGADTLKSAGDIDGFIAKLNNNGSVIWARRIGGTNSDYVSAVAPDEKGNAFVAGYFRDTTTLGNIKLVSWERSLLTMYLAKYDALGNCLWAKRIGASNYQSQFESIGLDVDPKGNAYLAGVVHNKVEVDTARINAIGTTDLFIAKFNQEGSVIWAKDIGAAASVVTAKSLRHDEHSSLYVNGYFTNAVSFDSKTTLVSPLGYSDVYLAKFRDNGEFVWVRNGSGRGAKTSDAMALDKAGNIYLTGSFTDTIRLANSTLAGYGMQNVYAASYDMNGTLRWARESSPRSMIFARSVAVDGSGYIYLAGDFNDTIAFGNHDLTAMHTAQDIFITKLSPHSDWTMNKTSSDPPTKEEITSFIHNKLLKSLDLSFSIIGTQFVKLGLYDMLGNFTACYTEEVLSSGTYHVKIDLKPIGQGSYYLRLVDGVNKQTKRLDF